MVNKNSDPKPTADQIAACPKLLGELVFWPDRSGDAVAYRIEVPSRGQFFTISREDYVFISLLDGSRSLAAACGAAAAALRSDAISQRRAVSLVAWLQENQLLASGFARQPAPEQSRRWWHVLRSMNPLSIRTPLPGLSASATRWAAGLAALFEPTCVAIVGVLMIVGLLTMISHWHDIQLSAVSFYGPGLWVSTITAWLVLKVLHELAHVAAAKRYGLSVSGVGIVWVLFAPLFYVDVTTCWRLRSRWQTIVISAAGMYVELAVAAIAIIVWSYAASPLTQYWALSVALAASVSTVLFNANALMRFDGYYILTDLLRMPNLSREASMWLHDFARRFFFGVGHQRSARAGWRGWFVIAYAIAAAVWRVLVCASLSIAAVTMLEGGGAMLVVLSVVCWLGPIAWQAMQALTQQFHALPAAGVRGIAVAACLTILAYFGICVVPVHTALRVPAVVRWDEATVLRCPVDGFVDQIMVDDGQTVAAGDTLLRLRNDELEHQVSVLNAQIRQCQVRRRIATGGQSASEVQVQREQEASLREQLRQLEKRNDALLVSAPRDGTVNARRLHQWMGRHVNEGQQLMSIVQPGDRHVLASIAQQDLPNVNRVVGQQVTLSIGWQRLAHGTLLRIDPGATSNVPHEALSGINDGPLAVRPVKHSSDTEQAMELLQPRFQAIIEIPATAIDQLPVGQCIEVGIGQRRETLAQRARLWIDKALNR